MSKVIIVPTDFTKEASCALDHAIGIAQRSGDHILLVHILNEESREQMKKEGLTEELVNEKLDEIGKAASAKFGLNISFEVREGSIFSTFGEIAKEKDARLIVMGTHGVVGIKQSLFGAHALKIAESSPVPVIIVQNKSIASEGYETIVFPVDTGNELEIKSKAAAELAKFFRAEIHLFVANPNVDDDGRKKIKQNVEMAAQTFKNTGVNFKEVSDEATAVWPGYAKQTIKYAEKVKAGLIVIQTDEVDDTREYIVRADNEKVINNEPQVAVMCISEKSSNLF